MKSLIEILENNNIIKVEENGEKYFTINSISEYLKIVKLIQKEPRGIFTGDEELIFRGESKFEYNLCPSILRVKKDGKEYNLLRYEKQMIESFLKLVPNEFNINENTIDLLSKMQHYGLPTRLIDFTFNPLVALYFAAISDYDCDGKIYVLSHRVQLEKKYNYIFEDVPESPDGQVHLCSLSEEYFDSLVSDLQFGGFFSSKIYHPKYISQREINQSAVFLVPNYKVSKLLITEEGEQYVDLSDWDVNYLGSIEKTEERVDSHYVLNFYELNCQLNDNNSLILKIPKELKKEIMYELNLINIDSDFIFPELNNISKKITDKYLSKIEKQEKSRSELVENLTEAVKLLPRN